MSRLNARPVREIPDTELIARTLAGDRDAYGDLVGRYLDTSYAVAYGLTGCRSDSDDLVQEAFLGAFQGLGRLQSPTKFGAWLTGILRRLDANRRRTARRRREVMRDYSDHRPSVSDVDGPVDEHDEELWRSIHGLPDELRVPLVLFYFEGESTAAVAERLNLEPATARKRVQLARDRLRERLHTDPRAPLARPELKRLRPSRALRTAIALTIAAAPFGAEASAAVDPSLFADRSLGGWQEPFGGAFPIKVAAAALFAIGLTLLIVAVREDSAVPLPQPQSARSPVASRDATPERQSTAADNSVSAWQPAPVQAAHAPTTPPPSTPNVTRTAQIRGTVRMADGSPLVCRQVFLGESRQPWARAESASLDESGTFHFNVDSEEDRWIYLLLDHALVCPRDSWVRPSFSLEKQLDIVVEPGVTLSGVIVDPDGHPVRRARVTLETSEPNQQGEALIETNRDGEFEIPHVPVGEYQMSISHAQHSRHLERIQLRGDVRRNWTLQPPRVLKLTIAGLPAESRESVIRFSLKQRDAGLAADVLAHREELLFHGTPDSTGTMTLQAPPPGVWTGTFYKTLPKRRFELVIPESGDEVHATVDLAVGAVLSGLVRVVGGSVLTEAVLVDVSGRGGRGAQLRTPIEVLTSSSTPILKYTQTGVPAGGYLAGVKQWIAGHPANTDQPEWIFYGTERLQLDGSESHTLDLTLPTTQPVHVTLSPESSTRSTSFTALTITPVAVPGLFTFTFEDGAVEPAAHIGALGLVASHRVAVFDHLPPGRYQVSAMIDGVRTRPTQINVGDAGQAPVIVELAFPQFVRVELSVESTYLPSRLLVQCPPAPTSDRFSSSRAWFEEYSRWLAGALVRDRVDPEFSSSATVHHFGRPYNDFVVGWHYWRSLVVRDVKFEGNLHVGSSGRATLEFPAHAPDDAIVRIQAPGFDAIEMRVRELLEYQDSPVPLFLK